MTENKYPLYGFLIAAGAVIAVWAGLPATFLILLLVCPLMMFFMMRGMHGDTTSHSGSKKTEDPTASDKDTSPDHTKV